MYLPNLQLHVTIFKKNNHVQKSVHMNAFKILLFISLTYRSDLYVSVLSFHHLVVEVSLMNLL